MTEKELQTSIERGARVLGWRVYHTWSSMHSPKGFPDLVMIKGDRLIFAELKNETGKVTEDQEAWLRDLQHFAWRIRSAVSDDPPMEVYVWRPKDLEEAYEILGGGVI
jgi:VRR-NUC domain-containing protein